MHDRSFDGVCPFCRERAGLAIDAQVISFARRCPCGAIALGAPRRDFDEVLDDALNYFGVRANRDQQDHLPPTAWLGAAGVDLVEGGVEERWVELPDGVKLPDHLHHYWFRRREP